MTDMHMYAGLPLDGDASSIRLLTLHGSRIDKAPISGSLYCVRVDSLPQYEALSYCWGDSKTTEDIIIDGHGFAATTNCAAALRALRLPDGPRTLWIDAICINQDDLAEKSSQVSLMRDIYAKCSKTIIWLGDSDKQSRKAFKALRRNTKTFPRSLTRLLQRQWFRRVWVIQEVAYAPEVMVQCGPDSVPWDNLVELLAKLGYMGSSLNPSGAAARHLHSAYYPRILNAAREKIQSGARFPLIEALRSFRAFDATRPVDKVYGIFGLLDDAGAIGVDYAKSTKVVFQDLAMEIIRRSRSLDIFLDSLHNILGPKLPDLPSWVPDWSDMDQVMEDDLEILPAKEPFSASRGTETDAMLLKNGHLRVSAQFVAQITELARRQPTMTEFRTRWWPRGKLHPDVHFFGVMDEVIDIFQSWKDVASRTQGPNGLYITNESVLEALYTTMQNRGPPFADYERAQAFDKWTVSIEWAMRNFARYCRYIAHPLPWPLVWLISGPYFSASGFYSAYKVVNGDFIFDAPTPEPNASRQGWVPGRTDNGLLGLFPAPGLVVENTAPAEVGDSVVIFKGAARPYVVRREGDCWKLIGDAYLHGCMHGAAFDESKCVTIDLC